MSASAVHSPEFVRIASTTALPEIVPIREPAGWNPQAFAREQIRGLVRQLFFSSAAYPVKQVVLCPLDAETGVENLCLQVGETLASEALGSVLVVTREPHSLDDCEIKDQGSDSVVRAIPSAPRSSGARLRSNLWALHEAEVLHRERERERQPVRRASLHSHLGDLRREFEHSIIEARPAAESSDAAVLGQLADGIVLVLSAGNSRRAMARKVKERLDAAGVRILGTVLTDRIFPIPEALYRRL
jgi:hypothetical protein